jgi:cephalosporin hydroxylase
MKLIVDTDVDGVTLEDGPDRRELSLFSEEGFAALSRVWVKVGWSLKYQYGFSWMGRPIIQLPEDIVRVQEAIYALKPTVIVETGVAHGGSLVLYASLLKAMGMGGRVVGVDIEIRPHNRAAIEAHELAPMITLVEGSSIDPATVSRVRQLLRPDDRVLVLLDSNHTKAHVASELEAYAPMVSVGSYIVATDGIMEDLHDVPRGQPGWGKDNPKAAAAEFAQAHESFVLEEPSFPFNEGAVHFRVTHWPGAWLRRVA